MTDLTPTPKDQTSAQPVLPIELELVADEERWAIDPALEAQNTSSAPFTNPITTNTGGKISRHRGRYRTISRPPTSRDLFPDNKTDIMASNKLIWEGCNILSQGRDLDWKEAGLESPYYESPVAKGKGYVSYWITNDLHVKSPGVLEGEAALALIDQFDIRAACTHLIYAAYATQLDRPWEQQFVISDQQLERYLGLDKNKKLNKQQKLALLLELAKQPCHLLVYVSWPEKGKVKSFSVSRTWLWEIAEPIMHFQENLVGESELVGFTLQIRAGNWARYFLNGDRCQNGTGYYEYGILSQAVLHDLMSIWHNHRGAARLMLWLLFKSRLGREPVRVSTLMKVAFGGDKLEDARQDSAIRKRLIGQWKTLLRVLDEHGWSFTFDLDTYPPQYLPDIPDLQPLSEIPDDPDQAAEFWANDAAKPAGDRLTDIAKRPYGGFEQLLTARMMVQPPEEIARKLAELKKSRSSSNSSRRDGNYGGELSLKSTRSDISRRRPLSTDSSSGKLQVRSGDQLKTLRLARGLTQAALADKIGKSTSWVKLVETGRRNITSKDQEILGRVLTTIV